MNKVSGLGRLPITNTLLVPHTGDGYLMNIARIALAVFVGSGVHKAYTLRGRDFAIGAVAGFLAIDFIIGLASRILRKEAPKGAAVCVVGQEGAVKGRKALCLDTKITDAQSATVKKARKIFGVMVKAAAYGGFASLSDILKNKPEDPQKVATNLVLTLVDQNEEFKAELLASGNAYIHVVDDKDGIIGKILEKARAAVITGVEFDKVEDSSLPTKEGIEDFNEKVNAQMAPTEDAPAPSAAAAPAAGGGGGGGGEESTVV